MLAVKTYRTPDCALDIRRVIVCGLRDTRRFPQLNSNGNCRVSVMLQVNNEHLPIGCMRKVGAIESVFEFEDSRMYLSEKTVIFIVIAVGRSNS
jgi:hypothetical protein